MWCTPHRAGSDVLPGITFLCVASPPFFSTHIAVCWYITIVTALATLVHEYRHCDTIRVYTWVYKYSHRRCYIRRRHGRPFNRLLTYVRSAHRSIKTTSRLQFLVVPLRATIVLLFYQEEASVTPTTNPHYCTQSPVPRILPFGLLLVIP